MLFNSHHFAVLALYHEWMIKSNVAAFIKLLQSSEDGIMNCANFLVGPRRLFADQPIILES